jgi:hypothetical protein
LCREPHDRNLAYHSFIWINNSIIINNEFEFGQWGKNDQEVTAVDSSEVKPGLPALITNTLKQIKPPLSAKTKIAFKTEIPVKKIAIPKASLHKGVTAFRNAGRTVGAYGAAIGYYGVSTLDELKNMSTTSDKPLLKRYPSSPPRLETCAMQTKSST